MGRREYLAGSGLSLLSGSREVKVKEQKKTAGKLITRVCTLVFFYLTLTVEVGFLGDFGNVCSSHSIFL